MSTPITRELNNYKEKIKSLDERASHLAEDKKKQYNTARSQFMSRLEAWQQNISIEIDQLRNNVEEGYHELESKNSLNYQFLITKHMNITTKTLKNLTYTTGFLAVLSVGFFGASAVIADTSYYYVTADNELAMVTADTPMEAMNEATDIKYNSGVIMAEELYGQGGAAVSTESEAYLYVDEDGNLDAEAANTPMEAISEADDIMYNSGVIEAEDYQELAGSDSESNQVMATGSNNLNTYAYLTTSEEVSFVNATTWKAALTNANEIDLQ